MAGRLARRGDLTVRCRFVFVPDSLVDEHDGYYGVEAAGSPGVLRVVSFAQGETDEGLDVAQPLVVEGELVVIRHPAGGQFPAVVELRVRGHGGCGEGKP